jgi:hypothetical protein
MTKAQQARVIADEIVTQSVRLVAGGRVAPENAAAVKAGMLAVATATIKTFGRYAGNAGLRLNFSEGLARDGKTPTGLNPPSISALEAERTEAPLPAAPGTVSPRSFDGSTECRPTWK